jgi:pilus assembly protein CpaF
MEGDTITLQDIFQYVQTGYDEKGKALGYFTATGVQPSFIEKFRINGIDLPPELFSINNIPETSL